MGKLGPGKFLVDLFPYGGAQVQSWARLGKEVWESAKPVKTLEPLESIFSIFNQNSLMITFVKLK